MKTIWKFKLEPNITLKIPVDSKILAVKTQYDLPYIWFLVDPDLPFEERTFSSYGTGHKIPNDPGVFIDTFLINEDGLVFHVFETT